MNDQGSPVAVERTWFCKIGESAKVPHEIPVRQPGSLAAPRMLTSDQFMRVAVEEAYEMLTGERCTFTFSGWGAELDESQRAVVEDREPDYFKTGDLETRLHDLREEFRAGEELPDWTPEQWATLPLIKLGEAAYYMHRNVEGGNRFTEHDRGLAVGNLLTVAAACLDAVEALESGKVPIDG